VASALVASKAMPVGDRRLRDACARMAMGFRVARTAREGATSGAGVGSTRPNPILVAFGSHAQGRIGEPTPMAWSGGGLRRRHRCADPPSDRHRDGAAGQ